MDSYRLTLAQADNIIERKADSLCDFEFNQLIFQFFGQHGEMNERGLCLFEEEETEDPRDSIYPVTCGARRHFAEWIER